MSQSIHPRRGAGHFQWNLGGWFGAVFGGSAWMLPTAGYLAVNGQWQVASVPLSCCLATVLIGTLLWRRRAGLDPFLAMMGMLAALAVATPMAWFSTSAWGDPATLAEMHWPSGPTAHLVVVLLPLLLMIWFACTESLARHRLEVSRH